jgi:hypothetical protein
MEGLRQAVIADELESHTPERRASQNSNKTKLPLSRFLSSEASIQSSTGQCIYFHIHTRPQSIKHACCRSASKVSLSGVIEAHTHPWVDTYLLHTPDTQKPNRPATQAMPRRYRPQQPSRRDQRPLQSRRCLLPLLLLLTVSHTRAFLLPPSPSPSQSLSLSPSSRQRQRFAATAAPTDATTSRAAAAAAAAAGGGAAAGNGEVEKGLVVLTREEGKNDKLRSRLEGMQVRVWCAASACFG